MTEKEQAYAVLSRKAFFVRCCLKSAGNKTESLGQAFSKATGSIFRSVEGKIPHRTLQTCGLPVLVEKRAYNGGDIMPKDPIILLSYINTKLRDQYPSLEEFCSAECVSIGEIKETLSAAGFEYDEKQNRFC